MAEDTSVASDASAIPEGMIETPVVEVSPVASAPREESAPTLDDAFHTLCRALYPLLEDDMPAQMHSNEIRAIYTDGNHGIAWTHAVMLLEQVLGARIGKP